MAALNGSARKRTSTTGNNPLTSPIDYSAPIAADQQISEREREPRLALVMPNQPPKPVGTTRTPARKRQTSFNKHPVSTPGQNSDWGRASERRALPIIEISNRPLRDMSDDAMRALVAANNPPSILVRGGELVRIVPDEEGKPRVQRLTPDAMRGRLARTANFISTSEKRSMSVCPPVSVVKDIMAQPGWTDLPGLSGIVTAPVFAEDGTLCDTPGYHPSSRFYYYQSKKLELPDTIPTKSNVASALSLLTKELLGDFPFVDKASEANALALLLLPYVRFMISGATPLHVIDAPEKGTGKGLLADACTMAFVPQGLSVMTAPVKEEEWGKTLLATLMESPSHIMIDNARVLNSAELEAALTVANGYSQRKLGESQNITVPVRCIWIATSNNLQAKGDLSRRLVWIRMDAGVEKPYERKGFRHPDLRQWILDNRAAIVGACITLVKAWIAADQPTYTGSARRGSYERWLSVMGGILETVGVQGFMDNAEDADSQMDVDLDSWRGFLKAWHDEHPGKRKASASELVNIARDFFDDLDGCRLPAQELGYRLKSRQDRVFGDFRLRRLKDERGSARYGVELVAKNVGN